MRSDCRVVGRRRRAVVVVNHGLQVIFGRARLDQHRRRAVVVVDVHGVGLGL